MGSEIGPYNKNSPAGRDGLPKPGYLSDLARKRGYTPEQIHQMTYNELLEAAGVEIPGEYQVIDDVPKITAPQVKGKGCGNLLASLLGKRNSTG